MIFPGKKKHGEQPMLFPCPISTNGNLDGEPWLLVMLKPCLDAP